MLASSRSLQRLLRSSTKCHDLATRSGHSLRHLATTTPSDYHPPPVHGLPGNELRVKPFPFQPDATFQDSMASNLARINFSLAAAADKQNITMSLEIVSNMKTEGVLPNLDTYNHLLRTVAHYQRSEEAWAIFDDMLLVGIQPDVQTFNLLLEAHQSKSSLYAWPILRRMESMSITPNATTYALIIQYFTSSNNLECALRYKQLMKSKGIDADFQTEHNIIQLAARQGHARLALDLATTYEDESLRRLEPEVWVTCLLSAASCLWKDGVVKCWEYVVQDLKLYPDEGLCIGVLNTAARHGLPDLATDALRVLKATNVQWKEHHFAPLVEAFCNAGQLKEAFITLGIMQHSDTPPSSNTVTPILNIIKKDVDSVDAAWAILEELYKQKSIDVVAMNLLLRAAVELEDLQRAVGAYKSFGEYKIKPNYDTFYTLLQGCITARHRLLGDLILDDLKEAGLSKDQKVSELMIELCLTQETYEDAFSYLEEMKAQGLVPSLRTYELLVRKCLYNGDSRHHIALDELKEARYQVSPDLHREIRHVQRRLDETNSAQNGYAVPENVKPAGLEGSARRFIETGGLEQ
ncbi:hypothetical protein D9758_001864 [Tetrapyrgos nigripes]|uniref:Pentatricopeptide repeat-containing protein-mitochondrial domain-containing protein n=1 Tax=Tetrapyrgos nigripes TaxID=182062 RepID=A0A8H5GTI6_9AGAR|nr:hypothetical protein D9758_001864 [Tetrapyrgos nigripes]